MNVYSGGAAAAAAVAAAYQRKLDEEEERLTPYTKEDLTEGWEFKMPLVFLYACYSTRRAGGCSGESSLVYIRASCRAVAT